MKSIQVRITGTSPLLQHRFPIEQNDEVSRKGEKDYKAEAETSLYRDENGVIYEPSTHLDACLKEAAKQIKVKGSRGATYSKIFGAGSVSVEPFAIPMENQKYEVDARAVVIQKARVVRYRPRFDAWSLSFTAQYDETDVTAKVVREAFDIAGRRVGIGDFRPQKGGPFGRFRVDSWEEE
jgi:hypothetical protein